MVVSMLGKLFLIKILESKIHNTSKFNNCWKEFKKNNPNDFKKCCGKIYLKCKCKKKDGYNK